MSREMALSFDLNVALKGLAAEQEAMDKAQGKAGRTTTRGQALALVRRARADVADMEIERAKRA